MGYKSLITLVFLSITSPLWSQENLHTDFEKKLVFDVQEMLFRAEAYKLKNNAVNANGDEFSISTDTLNNYKRIRTSIINKAHKYIGVSYRYGQSSEKGFDCSGFVKFVFRNFGPELPHSSYILYKISKHIETREAQAGDLVFFNTGGKGVSHVGIYLGNSQFIHSPGRGRIVSIDSLSAGYYKNHLVGFGSVL